MSREAINNIGIIIIYHYHYQHQVVAKFFFICDIIMIGIIVSSSSSNSIKFLAGLLYMLCMSWADSLLVALSIPHMDWLWPKLVG